MSQERSSIDLPPTKASFHSDRSPEDEEALPLYEDFQQASKQDAVPGPRANPDEVREYLTHLLIENRSLHTDHVRRVVSKWTVGTGQELRSYPPSIYFDLLGKEDGWIVYKEVKLAIKREDQKPIPDVQDRGPTIAGLVMSMIFIVVAWILIYFVDIVVIKTFAIMSVPFFLVTMGMCISELCDKRTKEQRVKDREEAMEKEVEKELAECAKGQNRAGEGSSSGS